MKSSKSVCCSIIPPFVLDEMLQGSRKSRNAALQTIIASERIRERRSLLGMMNFAAGGQGLDRRVHDCETSTNLPGLLKRSEGDAATGDASVNRAYDGLGETYRFYDEVFGRDSLDDQGLPLIASVHFGVETLNAFWNGSQMLFGDGDGKAFLDFTLSLDVIAHELTHGVITNGPNLEYHNQSGALNESLADVFGSLVKQFSLQQNSDEADWLIGADIVGPEWAGNAIRSMEKPGSAFTNDPQPGHMDDYENLPDTFAGDWGGVHVNSGIPNRAFFLFATSLGGPAWEHAGQVWYDSMLAMTRTSQFNDFARETIQKAAVMFGGNSDERKAATDAWEEVGVDIAFPAVSKRRGRRLEKESKSRNLKSHLQNAVDALQKAIASIDDN